MEGTPRRDIVRDIIKRSGSRFVSVKFVKKNGDVRDMTFNPKDVNEIKGTGTACSDPNIFRIREISNKEEGKTTWRSFDARRVLRICGNKNEAIFEGVEE